MASVKIQVIIFSGANYDEACIVDGDCTGKNAEKCDSSTSKCICSDGFFLNITAAECAASKSCLLN